MSDDEISDRLTAALQPLAQFVQHNFHRFEAAVAAYNEWGIQKLEDYANEETR